jgi:hypothetical protein
VALCPTTWSKSPSVIVHDVSSGAYAGDRRTFETRACPEGKGAKGLGAGELAKFKPTMNARGTSGTFSPSPLLYCHLSRFVGAETDDLFTAGRAALFGAMLRSTGNRYGSKVSGTRASGWGEGQNYDFQATAPFLALRSDKPLEEAVAEGLAEASRDPQIRRDMGDDTDPRQIVV